MRRAFPAFPVRSPARSAVAGFIVAAGLATAAPVWAGEQVGRNPFWILPGDESAAHGTSPKASLPPPRRFDRKDEAAALEAVQVALTEVGDGSSYVWYRHGGRLSGVVQPTRSFKDALGRVCRHLVVTLNADGRSSTTGAIACRLTHGGWIVDG
jgi:hypothetical protein